MSLSRFFGVRVISAAIAVVFFFTQGGFAQNPIEHKPVSSQLSVDILQDVHCNSQTQDSIYNYLKNLYVQNKLTGIFQEGASGNIDRSIWSKLEPSKRNKVIAGLYRDGWMGGAEKFAVEHPEISYVGIELKALYDIHREVYRDVTAKQESARKSLRELNENLTQLKSKFYSSKLIRLEKEWQTARHNGNSLYLFIKSNLKNVPENKLSELEPDFRALIEAIKNEKRPSNLSIEDFGSGIEKFHELLTAPLIQSDEAAKLVKIYAYYELLKDLWDLELTPQSYEKYLFLEKQTSLKADLAYLLALLNKEINVTIFAQDHRNTAKAFYEIAKRRDSAIYKNVARALKNKSGHFVLVTGGFHGQDLASRFKRDRISFSLVKPQFSEIDPNLQDKYARAMGVLPFQGDFKVYVKSLMALDPGPVTIRPALVKAFEETSLGFSLGKDESSLKSITTSKVSFVAVLTALILGLPSQVLAQDKNATTLIPNNLGTMILLSAAMTISVFTLVAVISRLLLSVKGFSLSEDWVSKPISMEESIHFTTKDSLTIDTESSKLKTLQFFEGKFGLAGREAKEDLSEGINYFIQSDSPKVEQVENLLIPALKIRQTPGGELQIGKFLPFGTEQSLSVRFQIGEDSAASAATLTLDDDPYLSNPVTFSQEQSFARWNDREISAAYVDLGDKLVLIIPKFGPMKIAEIRKGQFDAVDLKDNLEVIKNLSSELETAPVIITSEKIKFHSLTNDITDYKHPFIIKRESGMLTLRFLESVKDWGIKILQKNTLGPVPIRHKQPLAAAAIAALLLLSPVTYYLFFAPRALEVAVPAPQVIVPPAPVIPPAVPVVPPAPVASPTTPVAPLAPVVPPQPVAPPAPIASTTPVPPAPPVDVQTPNRFGLPYNFSARVEQAKHYIASPVDGIATVISDGAKVVVAPAGLGTRYLQKKARFNALAAEILVLNERYKSEFNTSLRVTNVELPIKSDRIQGMRDELVSLNRELVNLERELSRGAVDVNGGRLLVRNGDSVQAGGRIVELPVQDGRKQLEFNLPQSQGLAVLLGFVKLEIDHVALNNLTTYLVSNQGERYRYISEFDSVEGLTEGNNADVQLALTEEGKKAGEARPEILDVKAPHSGWYQILRGGVVSRNAEVVQSLGDRKDSEISEVERLIVINRIEQAINAYVLERSAPMVERARNSLPGTERSIARLQNQINVNPRDRESQDKTAADEILRDLSRISGEAQSASDAAASLEAFNGIKTRLAALTFSGSQFKTLSDNVSRALNNLVDQISKPDRDKTGDGALITELISKVAEARRFDPTTVPTLTEAAIAELQRLLKIATDAKTAADNLILDNDAIVRFDRENPQALQALQTRLAALKEAAPSGEIISSPSDGSVILFAGQNGIFWAEKDSNLFRMVPARANSLGMTRREALIRAAKLTALVGVGLTTGCLSQDAINRVMTDPAEGVPDSMITPAADVRLKEVVLKLDKITEILKNPTGTPTEQDLAKYIPERSYSIRDARFQKDAASGAQDILSGFAITPQFSVSTDFNGGFGVQGGFTIQVPAALGGGTLYIPIGVNSLEEDLKATLSFVSMTQNLIVGAGNYFSDMSQIALRSKEYAYDQQVNETLLKVQTIYREIWYLRKAIESSDKQIALLQDELTYANEQIVPNAGEANVEKQRYKTRIAGFLAQRQAEKDGFQSDINTKLETLRRILNLNPSVQFNFDFEGMNSDQVEDFTISGLTDSDEMLRIIALTDRRVGEAYGQYEALGHLLWLDSRKVNIPEAVISVFGGHNVADTFLFNPQDQNGINFLKPTNRYGGILFRGPELSGLISRIRNGNSDATDRLKLQRLVLDAAKKAVLEEVRDAKSDLDGKRDALKAAYRTVQTLRQELADIRTKRATHELDMQDDFAKQREINDAERDLLKKRAEFLTSVRSFQARYLPNSKEYLSLNVANPAAREIQTAKLGKNLLQHTKELTDSAIVWGTRTVSLQEFATGSSLGNPNKTAGLHFDKQNFASSILASKFGFVAALFGLVIGAGSRKRAWKEFQARFDQKIKNLTAASAPLAGQNSVVPIFAEERELSNNPEFINQFLKRSVDLEVFVNAANQEEAFLKMAKYFPEGTLPKNLQVHFYNKQKPIYSVMDSRIAVVAAAGTRPVVITSEAGLFKKLEQAKSIIKVSHEKNYPGELVMEIGRRIGLANGSYDQISGDEKSLIAYDSSRGVFYLRPIEKLINDLFQQVIRDYQIKIAA